jgi:hypothetical protein
MQNSVRRRGESLSGSGTASPSSQSQLSSSASAGASGRSQTRKGRGANPTTSGLSLRSCRCEPTSSRHADAALNLTVLKKSAPGIRVAFVEKGGWAAIPHTRQKGSV